jgi:hypothetical protein
MVNLCRDEVTHTLKRKIDQVYGSSFSTSGLGGVLTCGVTGVGAGLSHSPVSEVRGRGACFTGRGFVCGLASAPVPTQPRHHVCMAFH